MKIKLQEPIQFGSETIVELEMQKPRAKHFRTLPQEPTTGDLLDLAGRLCGQPPKAMDELCVEDMKRVLEAVASFLGSGLETGKNVSGL